MDGVEILLGFGVIACFEEEWLEDGVSSLEAFSLGSREEARFVGSNEL